MKIAKSLLGFVAGMFSGMMIFEGLVVFLGRDGAVGGEVLILPLMLLILFFGWDIGREYGYRKGKKRWYFEGYEDGCFDAYNRNPFHHCQNQQN